MARVQDTVVSLAGEGLFTCECGANLTVYEMYSQPGAVDLGRCQTCASCYLISWHDGQLAVVENR